MPLKRPTTTPVPDEIFDEWLSLLGEAELKVLLYIVRRTFGFDKRSGDTISYRQFIAGITTRDGRTLDRGCGISNRTNLARALKKLEERRLIRRCTGTTPEGDPAVTFYALWFEGDDARTDDDPRECPLPFPRRRSAEDAVPSEVASPSGGPVPVPRRTARVPRRAARVPPIAGAAPSPRTTAALPVVPLQHPQETVEQETGQQETDLFESLDGSTRNADDRNRAALQTLIADFSRELGDAAHERANLTRAVNLWRRSGLGHDDFVALLYEARRLTRLYQGRQPPGRRIEAKGAYFFIVLGQLLGARTHGNAGRAPPSSPAPTEGERSPATDEEAPP